MITLPLIPSAPTYSYPKEADKAPQVRYFPLDAILTRAWTTDAHTTAYSVPGHPYRLSRDAVQLEGGVIMVLFVADVDGPEHTAPDEWWLAELVKLDALRKEFPGGLIYRTRGGYRILYLLPAPRILTSANAVEGWRADYLSWIAALRLRFQIYADASCHDWQRLYRVPHATRTPGGRPEAREEVFVKKSVAVVTDRDVVGQLIAVIGAFQRVEDRSSHPPVLSFPGAWSGLQCHVLRVLQSSCAEAADWLRDRRHSRPW